MKSDRTPDGGFRQRAGRRAKIGCLSMIVDTTGLQFPVKVL